MHDEARLRSGRDATPQWRDGTAGECVIVLGNHISHAGIGDIAYTIYDHFSRSFRVRTAEAISPGKINILIDEFTNPDFVEYLTKTKGKHPDTRYVIVATEFYTPFHVPVLGVEGTFNFFGSRSDWRSLGGTILRQWGLASGVPGYMHRRYLGFVHALEIADVILSVHPQIASGLQQLASDLNRPLAPCATVYPHVDLQTADRLYRLRALPFGFAMTGSMTDYRAKISAELRLAFAEAGYAGPVYKDVPFVPAAKLSLDSYPNDEPEYLFNFNPPQQRKWPFSSPMRILRAALLGQMPVITKKFGDHEIEEIAILWDGSIETARRLWCEGTIGRETLIETFIGAIEAYNEVATARNKAVTQNCLKAGIG
jgi:hypothetical protein